MLHRDYRRISSHVVLCTNGLQGPQITSRWTLLWKNMGLIHYDKKLCLNFPVPLDCIVGSYLLVGNPATRNTESDILRTNFGLRGAHVRAFQDF